MSKPVHAKPSLYAYCFLYLKVIAEKYGYNLVLHGSLNRDMDLIAIPWQKTLGNVDEMIKELADQIGGWVMVQTEEQRKCFPHGRESYVINLNRSCTVENDYTDPQYYIDISVIPAGPINEPKTNADILKDIPVEPFKISDEDIKELQNKMSAFDAVQRQRAAQAYKDLYNLIINT